MSRQSASNRALWLSSFSSPPSVIDLPIPTASAGAVVIRVLATPILPYTDAIHNGQVPVGLQLPIVPNSTAIGRVYSAPPDAVKLKEGDLVYANSVVRARDDPESMIMIGHHSSEEPGANKLMQGEWRDGTLQQYHKVPLENCFVLNEQRLCRELKYGPGELQAIPMYAVAAGAIIESANVKMGDTVVVGPSGGSFGGLAVELALLLGANVIALGRDKVKLESMQQKLGNNPRLCSIVMTGDDEADSTTILKATPYGAGADVFNDWTPGGIEHPIYLSAAMRTLKRGGRVVLSGGAHGDVVVPYGDLLSKDINVMGKLMYTRDTLERVILFITRGYLNIGKDSGTEVATFGLDQHEEAIKHAGANAGWRTYTVVNPNLE
ncbi:chaperonin 10-like protein [Dactylonectria estremocensis]|uniref:Chaperonin 10-like protein n=1 Tax=Dactylonectria estremocensis TaxID=1079267 RepID=A0A9P9IP28_9HYPO|nr:chaperonin 10-like protein [Dactylonectria estremocensis]